MRAERDNTPSPIPSSQQPAGAGRAAFEAWLASVQSDSPAPSAAAGQPDPELRAVAMAIAISAAPEDMALMARPGGAIHRGGLTFRLARDGQDAAGQPNAYRIEMSGPGVSRTTKNGLHVPMRYTLPSTPVGITVAVNSMGGGERRATPEQWARFERMEQLPAIGERLSALAAQRRVTAPLPPLATPQAEQDLAALSAAAVTGGWSEPLVDFKLAKYFDGDPVALLTQDKPIVEQPFPFDADRPPAPYEDMRRVQAGLQVLSNPDVPHVRIINSALFAVCDGDRYTPDAYMRADAASSLHVQRPGDGGGTYRVSVERNRGIYSYLPPGAPPGTAMTPIRGSMELPPGSVLGIRLQDATSTLALVTLPALDAAGRPIPEPVPDAQREQSRRFDEMRQDPVLGRLVGRLYMAHMPIPDTAAQDIGRLAQAAGGWSEALRTLKVQRYLDGEPVESLVNDHPMWETQLPVGTGFIQDAADRTELANLTLQDAAAAVGRLMDDSAVSSIRVAQADNGLLVVCDASRYSSRDHLPGAAVDLLIYKPSNYMPDYQVVETGPGGAFGFQRPGEEPARSADHIGQSLPPGTRVELDIADVPGAGKIAFVLPESPP